MRNKKKGPRAPQGVLAQCSGHDVCERGAAGCGHVGPDKPRRDATLLKSLLIPLRMWVRSPGIIYLDLFKFRDGPFLRYEGLD